MPAPQTKHITAGQEGTELLALSLPPTFLTASHVIATLNCVRIVPSAKQRHASRTRTPSHSTGGYLL